MELDVSFRNPQEGCLVCFSYLWDRAHNFDILRSFLRVYINNNVVPVRVSNVHPASLNETSDKPLSRAQQLYASARTDASRAPPSPGFYPSSVQSAAPSMMPSMPSKPPNQNSNAWYIVALSNPTGDNKPASRVSESASDFYNNSMAPSNPQTRAPASKSQTHASSVSFPSPVTPGNAPSANNPSLYNSPSPTLNSPQASAYDADPPGYPTPPSAYPSPPQVRGFEEMQDYKYPIPNNAQGFPSNYTASTKHAPTPSNYTPVPSNYTPAPNNYTPAPSNYMLAPGNYAPPPPDNYPYPPSHHASTHILLHPLRILLLSHRTCIFLNPLPLRDRRSRFEECFFGRR
jgi:hypothetical protein